MIKFNEREYRDKLKQSLGFQDIPDDELYDHNMVLNSPMGLSNTLSISVGKYIDTDVDSAREAYRELEETFDDIEIPQLTENTNVAVLSNKSIFNGDNLKYFDIDVPNDDGGVRPFTVAVYVNKESSETLMQAQEQIRGIKTHFTFVGERDSNDLTGMEQMLSYYQFVNLVGSLINITDRNTVAAQIAEKIAMEFEDDDIGLDDIKKQFGFN